MENIKIMEEIYAIQNRIPKAIEELFRLAKSRAKTETEYRKELSKEILRLKAEGIANGLISEIAKGNINEILFEREINESLFTACRESLKALETQISALQTISKFNGEL